MERLRKIRDILKDKKLGVLPIFGDLDPSNVIISDNPKQVILYLNSNNDANQ